MLLVEMPQPSDISEPCSDTTEGYKTSAISKFEGKLERTDVYFLEKVFLLNTGSWD